MTDEDVTRSLLEEYSIAEITADDHTGSVMLLGEMEHEHLRYAFSRYAKVIFHDISDSYPTDADVQCCFSLTSDMEHKDGDVVGLFRLGWRCPSEIITSQIVPKPSSGNQREFQVQFKASDLPKDAGEIYQLCYISQNEVWGASVPFEFRRASAEELLVVDSGDLVIVRSQSAVAEDLKCQIAALRKKLSAAESSCSRIKFLEESITEMQEENKILKIRLKDLGKIEQMLERLRSDNEALDEARNTSEAALRESELEVDSLNSVVSSLQQDVKRLQKQVSDQANEITKKQNVALDETMQHGCNLDLIDALREGKALAVREMRRALAENEKMQQELAETIKEKISFLQNIEDLTQKYHCAVEASERNASADKKKIEELLVQLTRLTSDHKKQMNETRIKQENLEKQVLILETELQSKVKQMTHSEVASSDTVLSVTAPRQCEENLRKISILQTNLEYVQNRHGEINTEIQVINKELDDLKQIEDDLVLSQYRLTVSVGSLKDIIADADADADRNAYASHQIGLECAQEKLEETSVQLESAHQRRVELDQQLKELKQESFILDEQEAETNAMLKVIFSFNENDENEPILPTNQEISQKNVSHSRKNSQGESELSDLRERLRQAAEAYKTLYQEKLELEQHVKCIKERKKPREDRADE